MSDFKAEPDAVFRQEQWSKIARSNGLDVVPDELKQQICDALFDYILMGLTNKQNDAKQRRALKKLVKLTREIRRQLIEIQVDLRPEKIVDQVDGLIEEAHSVRKAASRELKGQRKPKGGRPRQSDRDSLAVRLAHISSQASGKRVGLSKSRDPQNPDRLVPGGPAYRFVSTIFKLRKIPTKGLEHVISRAAQHAKKPP